MTRTLAQPATRTRYSADEVAAMLRKQPRVRGIAGRAERTYNNRTYHSKAEALYAFGLDMQKSGGAIYAWRPQVTLPCVVNGVLVCKVILDFEIQDLADSPSKRYVELKGWESDTWKLKKKLLLACHPGIDLTVVKV